MDAVIPADCRVVAEQAYMCGMCQRSADLSEIAHTLHDISRVLLAQTAQQTAEPVAIGVVEMFVRVEPEYPLSVGMADGFIASDGKAIGPRQIEDTGTVLLGNCLGVVGGAGVHNDDFVHNISH